MSIQIDNGDYKSMAQMNFFSFQSQTMRVKRTLLKERGAACQECGCHGVKLHAHHLIHKAHGGTNNPNNIILLCPDCHYYEHLHGVGA